MDPTTAEYRIIGYVGAFDVLTRADGFAGDYRGLCFRSRQANSNTPNFKFPLFVVRRHRRSRDFEDRVRSLIDGR